jgi:uncharacterized protein YrrD
MRDERHDWLSYCHGYDVVAGGSRVGVVEDVLFGAERGIATALLVRGGLFGTRVTFVAAESVVSVSPRSKRVIVRDGA